jgi:transcriptional regulator with XRE-family HTH domain
MELKEWIKAARAHAGLSGESLGERIGRTKGNISAWENGLHEPSVSQVIQIGNVTGYPLTPLFAAAHGNVAEQAQSMSQSPREDAHTGAAVGAGQQTVSPDEVFKALSVRERARFARLLAAAFDDPPEIGVTVEGELWVRNDTSSARPRLYSEGQKVKESKPRRFKA